MTTSMMMGEQGRRAVLGSVRVQATPDVERLRRLAALRVGLMHRGQFAAAAEAERLMAGAAARVDQPEA